ncbi:inhibitor of sigma-G Gin [Desulfosporosinus sp. Tol-M]|jgi:Inhibitor of sigma-G Gin.|nr:inhibitor of sigma-G Gin [Desulfosporosinus sp. Tol-M]
MIKTIDSQQPMTTEIQERFPGHEIVENEGKVLPVCNRCAQVPRNGLYDGFRVAGMFFCSDCQQELFMAEQGSPEYQEFLFLIKGLLF